VRVFLDANILFSASSPGSATAQLFALLLNVGKAVTNPHAVEEARRNLAAKRPQQLEAFAALLAKVTVSRSFTHVSGIDVPEEDMPILAGAIGSRCTHLWTSDRRHFGALYGTCIGGVHVVSSVMLAEELLAT
jgi:hypothetical protein